MGHLDDLEWEVPDGSEACADGGDDAQTWSRREAARQRQIMIGKARPEYRRYVTEVPPERRSSSQPTTPDPRARISKRQFDRALGDWRRRLHEFDFAAPLFCNSQTPWEHHPTQDFARSLASSPPSGGPGAVATVSAGTPPGPEVVGPGSSSPASRSHRLSQRRNRGSARGVGASGVSGADTSAGGCVAGAQPVAFAQHSLDTGASVESPGDLFYGGAVPGSESIVRISLADRLEALNPSMGCAQTQGMADQQAQGLGANALTLQQAQQGKQRYDVQAAVSQQQAQLAQQILNAAGCGNVNPFEVSAAMCPWTPVFDESINMDGYPDIPQPWYPETPQKAPLGAQSMQLLANGEARGTVDDNETPEKQPMCSRPTAAQNAAAFAAIQASLLDDCGASSGFKSIAHQRSFADGHGGAAERTAPLSPASRPAAAAWPMPPPLPTSPRTPNPSKAARHQVLRTPNAKETGGFLDDLLDTHVYRTPASLAATPRLPCWALETPSPERVPRYDTRSMMRGMPLGAIGSLAGQFGGGFCNGRNGMPPQLPAANMGFLGSDFHLCYSNPPNGGFLDGSMFLGSTAEFPITPLAEVPIAPQAEHPNVSATLGEVSICKGERQC